jgi:hypothetical protein
MASFSCSVSQCPKTVSRYLPSADRRPRQSWRTFIRIQTSAFGQHQNPEQERSDTGYLSRWNRGRFMRSLAQIARLGVAHGRWHARRTLMPPTRRIAFYHRQSLRGARHGVRLDTAPGRSSNVCEHYPATPVPTRSPPHHARASPRHGRTYQRMPLLVLVRSFEEAQGGDQSRRIRAEPDHPSTFPSAWRRRSCRGSFPR